MQQVVIEETLKKLKLVLALSANYFILPSKEILLNTSKMVKTSIRVKFPSSIISPLPYTDIKQTSGQIS